MPWFQKGYSYGRNDSGPFQTWIAEGKDADVDADALNFLYSNWTYAVTRKGGGLSRMEAHAGWTGGSNYTSEVLENIWELDPQETDKDILAADYPNGSVNLNNTGSQISRDAVAAAVIDSKPIWNNTILPGTLTLDAGFTYYFDNGAIGAPNASRASCPSADYASAYSLFKLIKAGVTKFGVDSSIIRHTQLVSNMYDAQVSYSNVFRIFSPSSMVSIENVPTDLLYAVPAVPTPSQFIEVAGDLQYGFKKSRPAVTRLALFKWRIVQNYELNLWPIKLFGSVL